MRDSVVSRLIAKDLYLYRSLIAAALIAGAVSLVIASFSAGDNIRTGVNIGILLFITTIIAFGIGISMLLILKEHQDKSKLFVLSLPISAVQYSIAKVLAALIAFLIPWLALMLGAVVATAVSGPNGGIPSFVVMMTFFLVNFCLLLAVVVITTSELWSVAGILITNISVPVFLANIGRLPGAGRHQDAVATWSPAILSVLGIEIALVLLSLGIAFYVPSRKKDFI